MCGLFGEFGHSLIRKELFLDINSLSKNRGPDMSGYWTDNYHLQLGFNRLAILDVSENAIQPMISPNQKWVIAMNGEIYNYKEIRSKLGKSEEQFVSKSDTEVILLAFETWGVEETVKQLNGIFAIALFDKIENKIYLIRDFAGVKPLYFSLNNNVVVFASQYDQIFKHPINKGLSVRQNSLTDYIRLGYIPSPNAFFQNTWQVNPGEVVSFDMNMDISRYKYYDFNSLDLKYNETDPTLIPKLDNIFDEVINNQLISDRSIGSFLSGGIDSPLISYYMHKKNIELETFTVGSDDPEFDESIEAKNYASYLGVKNNHFSCSNDSIIRDIDEHFKAYSEPFGDYSSLPTFQICKMASSNFSVLLGGDGGDEVFWGYPRFAQFTSHFNWFSMPVSIRSILAHIARRSGKNVSYGISVDKIQDWVLAHHSQNNLSIVEEILPNLKLSNDVFNLYGMREKIKNKSELLIWLRRNEFYGHLQRVLLKVDRASMYHGLEVRVPFLDKKILNFMLKIKPELAINHFDPKILLKSLMRVKYPNNLIQRKKKGFSFNLEKAFKNILKDEVLSLLVDQDPYPKNTFNRHALNKYITSYFRNENHNTWGIWILYSLQKWAKQYSL